MSWCFSMRAITDAKEVLYRYRFGDLRVWVFLCRDCQENVEPKYEDTYQYNETWKSKK